MYRVFVILIAMATGAVAAEIDQPAALAALQRADSILIDVRTAPEYAEGALPGATRIEPQHLAERIASVAPNKDTPVVLYCRSGRRSAAAQDLLLDLGYTHVVNAGGYQDLKAVIASH